MVVHRTCEDDVRFVGSPPVPSAVGLVEKADDKAENSSARLFRMLKRQCPQTAFVGDLRMWLNG